MIEFPKNIKFKYSWRKYQQRVFDRLEHHLRDRHLHVIAPPGSGKTILGLEVALRLNQPVLILAPTLAIRNQWIQRFTELFLQTDVIPEWISKDIRQPGFMTVVTYQAMHAACNNQKIDEEETEDDLENNGKTETEEVQERTSRNQNLQNIVKGLKAQNVKTIVVDEAHHLQNVWWKSLIKIKEELDPVIIGLTATPPYDVSANEWQRYLELNGPVDTEISIPELVIEGDLCPHQDYVHFTLPTTKEYQVIEAFRENISKFFLEIKEDEIFIHAIETHPAWVNPLEHLNWIYNNISYYSAVLIFLHTAGRTISEVHLDVIGDKKLKIPVLDYHTAETLLHFYLFEENEYFREFETHRKSLENRLIYYGAIDKKQISLWHNKKVAGYLTSSISKLNSIKEIVDFEYKQLGGQLRMVILSDFIRKDFYTAGAENKMELNKTGIMPIFEKLRRENPSKMKIGVLTGSMIIIPQSAYAAFEKCAQQAGINQINPTVVPFDIDYLLIQPAAQLKNDIIHLVTQIFQAGEIEVLIGTKSLLGEGWDAPAINSLVLASFVGSFVLSNQMRGRAIRTQPGNPEKTGNIWHLVCIDPTSIKGGDDLAMLKRRFKGFVGVSFKEEPGIENGIGRLNIPENIHSEGAVKYKNTETFEAAGARDLLKKRWKTALESGTVLVEEIKIPFPGKQSYKKVKQMYFNKTVSYLVIEVFLNLFTFGMDMVRFFFRSLRYLRTPDAFFNWLMLAGGIGIIYFGKQLYKALRIYIKYRDISKDIHQIAEALLNALIKEGMLSTEQSKLKIVSSHTSYGAVYCHLEGGTAFEKSAFINALMEILGPIDNPRYVIIRKSWLMSLFEQNDYHSVPEAIGRNKQLAEYFEAQWIKLVGSCQLIFTRTMDGRKFLLRSRIKSLSAQFDKEVKQVNKWK